jgi:hypothetical protein
MKSVMIIYLNLNLVSKTRLKRLQFFVFDYFILANQYNKSFSLQKSTEIVESKTNNTENAGFKLVSDEYLNLDTNQYKKMMEEKKK